MNTLVTVIVPIYNVEDYLEECINSILAQTYNNLEIILVDDGSTDNSPKICDRYKLKDNRIKVVHKKNEGLGYARNSGMKVATGEFVTFVDSDDYCENKMIENLVAPIIELGADTVIGGFKRVNNEKKIIYIEKYKKKMYDQDVYTNFFSKMLGSMPNSHDSIRMSVWNSLYSLSIIKGNSIKFPSERKLISEDLVFDEQYYSYSKKVYLTDSTDYCYRLNESSLTQTYKKNRIDTTCALYEYMENIVANKNVTNGILRLQKQFLINLRMCISQENKKISKHNFGIQKKNIKHICNNKTVRYVVKEYPYEKLGFKQKIFFKLVKSKRVFLLSIFTNLNLF